MNVIPDFQPVEGHEYQVLPDGVYPCDEAMFYNRFVGQIAESTTREGICQGFFRLRNDAIVPGIAGTQWIDGSFVESKPDPEDLDVVTFCDYDELNAFTEKDQRFLAERLAGGESTKLVYRSHTFLVPSCDSDHEYFPVFEQYRVYWRRWFGTTRTGQRKGLIEMTLGDPSRAPEVNHERDEA